MKPHNRKTRIMVFGTFDILHKGHLNFFKQARKMSPTPYLIVSVARDANVKKIKGRKPNASEKQRLAAIKKCPLVDKSVLGGQKNYIPHILKEKPNIIALGYDQRAYVKNLKNLLIKRGLKVKIVRLKSYHPKIYKSSLFKRAGSYLPFSEIQV
jgi:FAD synthetase